MTDKQSLIPSHVPPPPPGPPPPPPPPSYPGESPVAYVAPMPVSQQYVQPPHTAGLGGDWHHGLCGCCSSSQCGPTCCVGTWCCFPCLYADASNKANLGISQVLSGRTESWDYWGTCCGLACLADCVPCGGVIMRFMLRNEIIKKYGMVEEGPVATFCYSWCCTPCSQCQMLNEIIERENFVFDTPWSVHSGLVMGQLPPQV